VILLNGDTQLAVIFSGWLR